MSSFNEKKTTPGGNYDDTVFRCYDGDATEVTQEKPIKLNWRRLMREFSRETTLHGFRYIAERDYFLARRILWLLMTVVCWLLLVLQILDRVTYYYSSPVTVNFQVNYNQSLQFPALTLCNQNAFRATAASRLGWYRVVETMFGTSRHNLSWTDTEFNNLTVDRLYVELGHRKKDFIRSCWWAGEPCTADNFTTTLTDHGLCYTFNNISHFGRSVHARASGAEHGLRLTLNTEQYEAMPGPHGTSGVKLLSTDQSRFPRVNEIGIGIPAGTHAYVGLNVVVIRNLPPPHGRCGDQILTSSDMYTPDMCQLECVTRYVTSTCGCRHFYMPNLDGTTPVCTIRQYFDCYITAYDYIHVHVMDLCTCPTSCGYLIYETAISSASTSAHVHDDQFEDELKSRFYHARETTELMKTEVYEHFRKTVSKVTESFERLKSLLVKTIRTRIINQQKVLEGLNANMSSAIKKKKFIYKFQEYSIQKNFLRARDAMEERTLSMVCLGFHEHVFESEYLLRELRRSLVANSSNAETIYILLKKMLQSRIETATRAIANQTQLYIAYETGVNIFNYKFKHIPRRYNSAIVPKLLLNKSLTHNYYARRYAPRVRTDIESVLNTTREFEAMVKETFEDSEKELNVLRMENISKHFIDDCEDYFHSKSTFYFEVVERPLRIISKRFQDFTDLQHNYEGKITELETHLQALETSLMKIEIGSVQLLTDHLQMAQQYFNDSSADRSKFKLAKRFTSKNVSDYIYTLTLFMTEVRQRGLAIFGAWKDLRKLSVRIWNTILKDEDSFEYYQKRRVFLQNLTILEPELERLYDSVRDENDLRLASENVDNEFVLSLTNMVNHLEMFLDGSEMDSNFIRNNFLKLEIYFKELRHELIEQQQAYDAIALLCDIGGSIGLFVGASTLTVFELLDFIINTTAVTMLARRRRRRRKQ